MVGCLSARISTTPVRSSVGTPSRPRRHGVVFGAVRSSTLLKSMDVEPPKSSCAMKLAVRSGFV